MHDAGTDVYFSCDGVRVMGRIQIAVRGGGPSASSILLARIIRPRTTPYRTSSRSLDSVSLLLLPALASFVQADGVGLAQLVRGRRPAAQHNSRSSRRILSKVCDSRCCRHSREKQGRGNELRKTVTRYPC